MRFFADSRGIVGEWFVSTAAALIENPDRFVAQILAVQHATIYLTP